MDVLTVKLSLIKTFCIPLLSAAIFEWQHWRFGLVVTRWPRST